LALHEVVVLGQQGRAQQEDSGLVVALGLLVLVVSCHTVAPYALSSMKQLLVIASSQDGEISSRENHLLGLIYSDLFQVR
jgi:hypothetical protein